MEIRNGYLVNTVLFYETRTIMGSGKRSSRKFLENKMICGCVGCTAVREVMTDRCLRDGSWASAIENWRWIPFYENDFDANLLSCLERGGWETT
jgi:hypothetical protein